MIVDDQAKVQCCRYSTSTVVAGVLQARVERSTLACVRLRRRSGRVREALRLPVTSATVSAWASTKT